MELLDRLLELPLVMRRNFSLPIAHSLIKTHLTDQCLVSYPRSGSTWLRTILAAIIDPEKGFAPEVFNRILPGVSGNRLPLVWRLNDPRVIHSHTPYRKKLPRVVYIVRDGRDAIVSHYHHSVTRRGVELLFPDWFELYCKRWYGPRWHDNVEGWLTKGRDQLGENFMLIRFEDMKNDLLGTVQNIAEFLGLPTELNLLSHAIEMASLEKARKREEKVTGELNSPNASFYRGGKVGQWQELMDDQIYNKFMQMSLNALTLAGYTD